MRMTSHSQVNSTKKMYFTSALETLIILEHSETNVDPAITDLSDFHVREIQQIRKFEENSEYEMTESTVMEDDTVKIQILNPPYSVNPSHKNYCIRRKKISRGGFSSSS